MQHTISHITHIARAVRSVSPAAVAVTVALLIGAGGFADAATGGNFILGKANTATSVTTLSNTKGTALSLSAPSGKAPLTVSNSVQVPKLNASLVDGHPATAFVTGSGQVTHVAATVPYGNTVTVNLPTALSGQYKLSLVCSSSFAELYFKVTTGNLEAWFTTPAGEEYENLSNQISAIAVVKPFGWFTTNIEVASGTDVVTTELSLYVNANTQTCIYAGQAISNG